jgi:hypothetical protein
MTTAEVREYENGVVNGNPPFIEVEGSPARVVLDRELMIQEALEKYGPCQMKQPNGTFMRAIRDPTAPRVFYDPNHSIDTPLPQYCDCASHGAPHLGRHHPLCPCNKKAPPEHRALPEDYRALTGQKLQLNKEAAIEPVIVPPLPPGVTVLKEPTPQQSPPKPVAMALKKTAVESPTVHPSSIPEPQDCTCKNWTSLNPEPGKQHNAVCQHFLEWAYKHPLSITYYLVECGTLKPIREATIQEIRIAAFDMGRIVRLDGDSYQVVTESELENFKEDTDESVIEDPEKTETLIEPITETPKNCSID